VGIPAEGSVLTTRLPASVCRGIMFLHERTIEFSKDLALPSTHAPSVDIQYCLIVEAESLITLLTHDRGVRKQIR
jgi:hypothetical protein